MVHIQKIYIGMGNLEVGSQETSFIMMFSLFGEHLLKVSRLNRESLKIKNSEPTSSPQPVKAELRPCVVLP